jgi:hypothetical protein
MERTNKATLLSKTFFPQHPKAGEETEFKVKGCK